LQTKVLTLKLVVFLATMNAISVLAQNAQHHPPNSSSRATETTIEQMPAKLETQFALSALPPAMRDPTTVYVLDPNKGYQLSRQGTNGVTCLVERTAWEQANFRNDIYVPLCYDAKGSKTFLKVIMEVAELRIQGMTPDALKAEIENRYKNKTYHLPDKPGLSYMIAPVMRTWMMPDFKEGIAEQSYMIQLIGASEKTRILADEKPLLHDLCAYRDVLCLANKEQ